MARNYMQDITPSGDDEASIPVRLTGDAVPERSIRSIRPSSARARMTPPPRPPEPRTEYEPQSRSKKRWGVWIAAIIALLVLGVASLLILFPSTSVTVVPHTHVIPFDASSPFTAYPENSAAAGTIAYTVISQVFEDSATVAASGTEEAEEQATGNITVYNEYSDQSVRLIKNTRFQTASGLIFRIPASVDVPGRSGTTPGSVTVTVFADQTGPNYNVPASDFTLPGLKSTPEMYEKVYAKSTAAFSGGFSGERPAVSASVLDAAKAEVRGRLTEKANQLAHTAPEGSVAFPGLMAISFETLPPTPESGGSVRINERATVVMPIFPGDRLAQSIAQAVSANAEGQSVSIRFADNISAQIVGSMAAADVGQQPLTFTLNGRGQLVWRVDGNALTEALAGREESAFETIIQGFPAIEEARARLMPFWKGSFPADAAKIDVVVEEPAAAF